MFPRATNLKATHKDTVKNTVDKLKWITKKHSSNPKEDRKGKSRNKEEKTQKINKIVDLNPNRSIMALKKNKT